MMKKEAMKEEKEGANNTRKGGKEGIGSQGNPDEDDDNGKKYISK